MTNAFGVLDGKRLLSGCLDGKVGLWDTSTGQIIHMYDDHDLPVTGLVWLASAE